MPEPRAKRQKTMSPAPTVIDAAKDAQGDIHLKAGSVGTSVIIRAHSALLKMASPVFKAMLGPTFVEGATVYTKEKPLLLPDDDFQALALLCAVLHHQCDAVDDIGQLIGLTVLTDKYQCGRSIKPFVSSLLGPMCSSHALQWSETGGQEMDIADILSIAYLVNDQRLFWRASRRILALIDINVLDDTISKELRNILPAQVLDDLHERQIAQRGELLGQLKQLIPDYSSRCSSRPRDTEAQVVAALQWYLWQWNSGHSTNEWLPDNSLQDTWANMELLANRLESVSDASWWNPADKLRNIIADSKEELVGLCLDCARRGLVKGIREDCGHPFRD